MVYLRRLIWFIAKKLVILCVLLGILVCGFTMALNLGNVYVILTEGMERRVSVILTRENSEELNKYFTGNVLSNDPALAGAFDGTSAYCDYTITDFEYELEIEKLWAWPWDDYATCTVVERVPEITGKVLSSRRNEVSSVLPSWVGGRYKLTLAKDGDQWKIAGIQLVTSIVESTADEQGKQTENLNED